MAQFLQHFLILFKKNTLTRVAFSFCIALFFSSTTTPYTSNLSPEMTLVGGNEAAKVFSLIGQVRMLPLKMGIWEFLHKIDQNRTEWKQPVIVSSKIS